MPTIECSGKIINVDDEGYLTNFDDWTENIACELAEREGLLE